MTSFVMLMFIDLASNGCKSLGKSKTWLVESGLWEELLHYISVTAHLTSWTFLKTFHTAVIFLLRYLTLKVITNIPSLSLGKNVCFDTVHQA